MASKKKGIRKKGSTGEIIRVTKTGTFEMAHALDGYDGPCKNIHGHSYKIRVTVAGRIDQRKQSSTFGMVLDFKELKSAIQKVIKKYDHALLLNESSSLLKKLKKINVMKVPFQPTCENLLIVIKDQLIKELGDSYLLHSIGLNETETCYAEWHLSDNNE